MRHTAAALLLALASAAAPARAAEVHTYGFWYPQRSADGFGGLGCGMVSVGGEVQNGVVYGGPIAVPAGHVGSIRCTVQVGSANSTHAGANAARGTSAPSPGAAYLPPTPISYEAGPSDDVYLCTVLILDGTTYYHFADPQDPTVAGWWTTDPNVDCGVAVSFEVGG